MTNAAKNNNVKPYSKWWFWTIPVGIILIISLVAVVSLNQNNNNIQSTQTSQNTGTHQKTSSDINVAYIKQYVGQNLASACDWSWTDKCLFPLKAGNKNVNLIVNIISSDGRNFSDDNIAKFYKITSQSIPQNSEVTVIWDEDDWTLLPSEIDVTVEPIGKLKEITKTGEVERYTCRSQGGYTGRVVNFIKKNSSSGLQSDSYDIVKCEWTEIVLDQE